MIPPHTWFITVIKACCKTSNKVCFIIFHGEWSAQGVCFPICLLQVQEFPGLVGGGALLLRLLPHAALLMGRRSYVWWIINGRSCETINIQGDTSGFPDALWRAEKVRFYCIEHLVNPKSLFAWAQALQGEKESSDSPHRVQLRHAGVWVRVQGFAWINPG